MSEAVRVLIRRMAAENSEWGAPRIHGELLKVGFEVGHNVLSGLDSTTVPIVGSSSSTGDTSCWNVSEYDTPPPGYGIESNLNNGNPNQRPPMQLKMPNL